MHLSVFTSSPGNPESFLFFPCAHSNNKCRGTGDPLVLYSFFWVLNFMQQIWFLLQLGRQEKKSKSSPCSIEKKSCALCFYFSGESIQKLLIFFFFSSSFDQGCSELFTNNLDFFTVTFCGLCIFFSPF